MLISEGLGLSLGGCAHSSDGRFVDLECRHKIAADTACNDSSVVSEHWNLSSLHRHLLPGSPSGWPTFEEFRNKLASDQKFPNFTQSFAYRRWRFVIVMCHQSRPIGFIIMKVPSWELSELLEGHIPILSAFYDDSRLCNWQADEERTSTNDI